nr:folate-binding protein [uncultured Sphingomonas sp.]
MPATTLPDRAVIRLSGEDVRSFLQALVTNDVTGTLPVWAGLLSAQGKCLFDFLVWAEGDDLLIDCEAEGAEDLAKRLRMYRLRRPITIELDEALAVHWSADGEEGVPDPRLPELGRRWLAPAGEPATGWLRHRLSFGVCEGRSELGDLLWLECNAAELHGVSFTKGCYVGQENTARMNWRQKVNRRLVAVPAGAPTARSKAFYPDLGLAVEHRRVDDLAGVSLPAWLRSALSEA